MNISKALMTAGLLPLAALFTPTPALATTNVGYVQVNLVSDLASNAPVTDPRLVNPWGLAAGPDTVWVNDNGPGLVTVYGPFGHPYDFAINVPSPAGGTNTGTPSGLVLNETARFVITNGSHHAPSSFLIATEDGMIVAWNNQLSGSNAVIMVNNSTSGAVYKGLAISHGTNGDPRIYAANFHAGTVDVFSGDFQPVMSFTDTNIPPLFAPFGIRHIRGYLFVTYAKQKLPAMHDDDPGPGNGFIEIFDGDGNMLRRFASRGALNSPWGLVEAPANFGKFSHSLLVGNFGDGRINSYNFLTGELLGNLTKPNGDDIVINSLWGLDFEQAPDVFGRDCEYDADRLYFTAGLNNEADGLLGYLRYTEIPIVILPIGRGF